MRRRCKSLWVDSTFDFADTSLALEEARASGELQLRSERVAVVVHGLGRSRSSMSKLRESLHEAGWDVLDMGYPSTRRSLGEHAEQLGELLNHLARDGAKQAKKDDARRQRLACQRADGSKAQRSGAVHAPCAASSSSTSTEGGAAG